MRVLLLLTIFGTLHANAQISSREPAAFGDYQAITAQYEPIKPRPESKHDFAAKLDLLLGLSNKPSSRTSYDSQVQDNWSTLLTAIGLTAVLPPASGHLVPLGVTDYLRTIPGPKRLDALDSLAAHYLGRLKKGDLEVMLKVATSADVASDELRSKKTRLLRLLTALQILGPIDSSISETMPLTEQVLSQLRTQGTEKLSAILTAGLAASASISQADGLSLRKLSALDAMIKVENPRDQTARSQMVIDELFERVAHTIQAVKAAEALRNQARSMCLKSLRLMD